MAKVYFTTEGGWFQEERANVSLISVWAFLMNESDKLACG